MVLYFEEMMAVQIILWFIHSLKKNKKGNTGLFTLTESFIYFVFMHKLVRERECTSQSSSQSFCLPMSANLALFLRYSMFYIHMDKSQS